MTLLNHVYIQEHLKKRKITCDSKGRWNTRFRDKNGIVHQIRHRTLEGMLLDLISRYETDCFKPTVRSVFYEWMNERLGYREIQKSSYDRDESDFKRFFVPCGFDKIFISEINEEVLYQFIRDTIRDYELSSKRWNNLKMIITGMFRYAKFRKYTDFSISAFFADYKLSRNIFCNPVVKDEEQVFTDDEMATIFAWINGDPERRRNIHNLAIMFCFYTGLRAGELSAIRFSDFQDNILRVSRTEVRYRKESGEYRFEIRESTKGSEGIRYVIVPPEGLKIIEEVRKLNPEGSFVFMIDGHRIKADRYSKKLKRICGYIEIPPRSLHKIRKTYATILVDAGCDDSLIRDQMGHTDIRTTLGHYYYRRKNLKENTRVINEVFSRLKGLQ